MSNDIFDNNESTDIIPVESEALVAKYLELRLSVNPDTHKRYSKEDIAQEFGVSRQTLNNWLQNWNETGLLESAASGMVKQIQSNKVDAMRIASAALPEIIAKQVDDALNAKFANHRNAAARFIMEFLQMVNALDLQDRQDEGEQKYLKSNPELNNPRSLANSSVTIQFVTKPGEDIPEARIVDMPS